MNEDVRLAQVTDSLARVGMRFLVMGGHAVRHYGVMRHTIDVDLHVSAESHQDLVSSLARSALFGGRPPLEGPSWRPADFRRFFLGRLPDGREEWLEFWLRNHLLAPFEALYERREMAEVQGIQVPFMALPDLLRSKETEREDDWQDVSLLEEILDARHLAEADSLDQKIAALARLRSRRGFRLAEQRGLTADVSLAVAALGRSDNPISQAFLLPILPNSGARPAVGIPDFILAHLMGVEPGSARHHALVEAVRRVYRQGAMSADRADKLRASGVRSKDT